MGAGVKFDEKGKPVPLFKTGKELDAKSLEQLRTNEVTVYGRQVSVAQVKVNEFSFSRWQGKWYFLLAAAGMGGGVLLVRTAASKKATEHRESGKSEDLMAALQDAQQRLSDLHAQLKAAADPHDALPQVVEALTALGGDLQVNFIDHLEVIRSLLATGKMAEVMESYAVAERFTNRARSTAVDNDPREALACLETAAQRMGTTLEMLQAAI